MSIYLRFLDWWSLAGWASVNILIPVSLPFFVLWLFCIPRVTAEVSSGIIIKSIGKGELLWAAMSMAAATCHELLVLQKLISNPNGIGITWLILCIHLAIILSSAILVGLGAISNSVPSTKYQKIPDPKIFRISIAILGFTIVAYACTHATLSAIEAKIKAESRAMQKTCGI